MMKRPSVAKTGFTLIELLVAISILSILAAIGISIFNMAQKNVRDQKRLRDLNTMKQALELYRSDSHYYPVTSGLVIGTPNPFTDPAGSKVYLDVVPNDFITSRNYVYRALPGGCDNTNTYCDRFVVCAKKEGSNSINLPDDCKDGNLSCAGEAGDCDMGVSSD